MDSSSSSKYFHSLLTSINSNSNSNSDSDSNSNSGCYACGYKETNENNEMTNISNTSEDDNTSSIIRRLNDYHTLQNLLLDLRNEYTNNTTRNTTTDTINKKEMIVLEATRDDLIQKIDKMTNNVNESNITLTALNYRKIRNDNFYDSLYNSNINKSKIIELKGLVIEELNSNINTNAKVLLALRYRAALRLFLMFPINPTLPENYADNDSKKFVTLTGISTICSIPMTNNGDDNGIPTVLVLSSLSFVSQLLNSLSSLLNVPMPHMLETSNIEFSMISSGEEEGSTLIPLTPRISTNADIFDDETDTINNNFSLGLSLLRSNVISLCASLGVPLSSLFPKQAMLLNLHLLHLHIIDLANSTAELIENIKVLPPSPLRFSVIKQHI